MLGLGAIALVFRLVVVVENDGLVRVCRKL